MALYLNSWDALKNIQPSKLSNGVKEMLTKFAGSAAQYWPEHHYQVWQTRFDDLLIRTEKQYLIKSEYIHNNPLQERRCLASAPEEYPFSSARFYLRGEDAGVPIAHHPWAGDGHGMSPLRR